MSDFGKFRTLYVKIPGNICVDVVWDLTECAGECELVGFLVSDMALMPFNPLKGRGRWTSSQLVRDVFENVGIVNVYPSGVFPVFEVGGYSFDGVF